MWRHKEGSDREGMGVYCRDLVDLIFPLYLKFEIGGGLDTLSLDIDKCIVGGA